MFSETDSNYQCPVPGCNLSAEEEHRIARGAVAEAAAHRAKLRQPEAFDLSTISTNDLLTEIARRINQG